MHPFADQQEEGGEVATHVHATDERCLSDNQVLGSQAQCLRCIILACVILLWVCQLQDLRCAVVRLYQDLTPPLGCCQVLLQRSIGTGSAALTAALQGVNGDRPPPVGRLECNRRFSVLGGHGRHLWPLCLGTFAYPSRARCRPAAP